MESNLLRMAVAFSMMCGVNLATAHSVSAQSFSPGEIVIIQGFGETTEGRVIKQDSSGVLVLLKDWQDGTYKTGGSSRYYAASEIQHKTATPAANPAAQGGAGGGYSGGGYAQAQGGGGGDGGQADMGGTGPLSKQQIIDYLRARIGTDGPHPKKDSVCAAVVEQIKKRGVNFKYSWQDLSAFMGAGANTTVTYAIGDNFGAPVQMPWLTGAWELQFTNATGFFASRDSAAKLGFLSIEPSHSYIWKIHEDDPASKWIDGKWREATPEEMKYQGGAGIVILNGEQNMDFIVHKDQTATQGQDWINVADLGTRQIKRGGLRKR
ncbi:MAG: hypothetical protein K2W95_18355 [Candidatus Obscuribacterales bacterium]|nr:hypothetical protein [Candidatus Obscuribacterales bacterium]